MAAQDFSSQDSKGNPPTGVNQPQGGVGQGNFPQPNMPSLQPTQQQDIKPAVSGTPPGGGQPAGKVKPPPPKRKFPKKALFIVGGVLVFILLAFLVFKFVIPRFGGTEEKTVTWWGLWEDTSIVQPLIDEYEKGHPNVDIVYKKQSPKDYRERLVNALARGEGPDIFRFHNTWVPMFSQELDTVPVSVMSAAEFAQTFYPVVSIDLSSGTGVVGIPLEYDGITLFINEDIFDKAGKTPPKTWDDLKKMAIGLTVKDERGVISQAGVSLGRTENVDHWPEILGLMMLQNKANPANPTNELAEDALIFFTRFSSVDGVWDETMPPSTTAFAAGKLAMYFGPSWRAFEIKNQNPELNFKTVPLPQLPKETGQEPDVSYATYWVEGVWARSQNKEAAWDFLKFISEKESLEKLYQNASKTRMFGEPYPRVDMASLLTGHPIVGSIISLAPNAQSWYLASRSFDGPTGINSQVTKYYEDAINAVNEGSSARDALETAAAGISQVLSQYKLFQ